MTTHQPLVSGVGWGSGGEMETAAKQQQPPPPPPQSWTSQLLMDPFHLFHFLLFFSYFVARSSAAQTLPPDLCHHLLRREIQAILVFLVYAVVKVVQEESWEGFIADTLFYAKGFLLAVALVISYHLALCYIVAFLAIFVLSQQPAYADGLGDSSQLTPLQLEALLTEGNTSRFWLVEFHTLCSPTCVRTSRFIPELSVIYSNKNISFATVDLGHFPNTAEKFGISLGVTYGQLPTYILFDHVVEVARLPDISGERKFYTPNITKSLLCRHFELDRRLIEYVVGK